MATKIVTKNSSTASAVPTASDLVQGELAVNVADKRLFTEDNAGAIVELGTNPTTLNVNGTATMDGLVVDGTAFVNLTARPTGVPATAGALWSAQIETGNYGIVSRASSTDSFTYIGNTGSSATLGTSYGSSGSYLPLDLQTSDKKRLRIASSGDISFYEDTGTTAKFFWDASAESLTVGNSSGLTNTAGFSGTLGVKGSLPSITIEDTSTGTGKYTLGVTSGNFGLWDSTSSSYRMFVSSAGNVGIGTSSPSAKLHVDNGSGSALFVGLANSIYSRGNEHIWQSLSNTSEYMRISAGNLLVGKTTTAIGTQGIRLEGNNGKIEATRSGNVVTAFNRTGSDGTISEWMKDGTTVGSIGAISSDLEIHSSVSGHVGLRFANGGIFPTDNTGAVSNGVADIGNGSFRFKDLYLSGEVIAGAGANNNPSITSHVDTDTGLFFGGGNILGFSTGGAERMRIDSGGNLMVGATASAAGARLEVTENAGNLVWFGNSSGTGLYMVAGGTAWVTSSDERVKDIIEPISGAIDKLSTLRTVIGKYKTDNQGVRRPFLIAQDLQAVFPEAVNEQEDELKTLGVEYSSLIPLLIAGMKEQQNLIESLIARVAALEE